MKPLKDQDLALLAGRELNWWNAPLLKLRLVFDGDARAQVASYTDLRRRLHGRTEAFELPKGFDWSELEAEMIGNIRLGAEVSRITPPRRFTEEWMDWRGWIAIAALTTVVMTGWFLTGSAKRYFPRTPGLNQADVRGGELTLSASPLEVGLHRDADGAGVVFRSAQPTSTKVSVGLEGSLRAVSLDQDSGQLTVTQVSLEDERFHINE